MFCSVRVLSWSLPARKQDKGDETRLPFRLHLRRSRQWLSRSNTLMKISPFTLSHWRSRFALAAAIVALTNLEPRAAETGAASDFHPVDLAKAYSQKSDGFEAGTAWSAVPWGQQSFDGIPFALGGIMELTGMGAARD